MTEFETDGEIREILKSNGIVEAHRLIAEYRCYRNRKDGETQDVLVRIFDMGPDNPRARYSWEVSETGPEEPRPLSANSADSIVRAGHNPHWHMLDTDARRGEE